MRKTALTALVGILVASIVAAPAQAAGTIDTEAERRALALVSDERSSRGIAELKVDADLVAVAREHSRDMASEGELRHNENLGSQVEGYAKLGENVGYGSNADEVHGAFMGSDAHRRNILDGDYTKVGIGVVRDGDTVWITQVFMQPAGDGGSSGRTSSSGGSSTDRDAPRETVVAPVATVRAASAPVRAVRHPRRRARVERAFAGRTLSMLGILIQSDVAPVTVAPVPTPSARPNVRPSYWG